MNRTLRAALSCAVAITTAGMLAACGSSSPKSSSETAVNTTDGSAPKSAALTMVAIPTIFSAPAIIAEKKGFFAEQGLNVQVQQAATVAAEVPLLLSNKAQYAVGATPAFIVAASNGIPVQMVCATDAYGDSDDQATSSLVAAKGSKITTPEQLSGKTVALPALKAMPELMQDMYSAKYGIKDVKLIQLPMADAVAALRSGHLEVAQLASPYDAEAVADGGTIIGHPDIETLPGATAIAVAGNKSYLAGHAGEVVKIQKALDAAVQYANAHPDEAKSLTAAWLKLPTNALSQTKVGIFTTKINLASLDTMTKKMNALGWLKSQPAAASLVFAPPSS
jgi:NitT/TauT family transport system substrate-binding protein